MAYFPNLALIYLFEAVIEEIQLGSKTKTNYDDLKVTIECENLLNAVIDKTKSRTYDQVDLRHKENDFNAGKTIFFCATPREVQEIFKYHIQIDILKKSTNEKLGTATLSWNEDFDEQVVQMAESNAKSIQHSSEYQILNNEQNVVGKIVVHLHLNCFGRFIEVDYHVQSSYVSLPKYRQTPDQANEEIEVWRPLFVTQYSEKESIMDPDMRLYAQMAGVPIPPSEFEKLTPDYINSKLCKAKNCPAAMKFKKYGIGPLASSGSGLGTIQSLKFAKPATYYGMSQAYGTLANYGPYGLFAKPVKHPKTICDSPNCPYKALNQRLKSIETKHSKDNNNCCTKCSESDTLAKDVPCPFLKKNSEEVCSCGVLNGPRLSAGADKSDDCYSDTCGIGLTNNKTWSSNHYNTNGGYSSAAGSSVAGCHSHVCGPGSSVPANPSYYNQSSFNAKSYGGLTACPHQTLNPQANTFSSLSYPQFGTNPKSNHASTVCGGQPCPYNHSDNFNKPSQRRTTFQTTPDQKSKKTNFQIEHNCPEPDCPGKNKNTKYDTTRCKNPNCPFSLSPDELYAIDSMFDNIGEFQCKDEFCQLGKQYSSGKSLPGAAGKHLSLLLTEKGKNIVCSAAKTPKSPKDFISTISMMEETDLYFLLSRFADTHPKSHSMNNYYEANETNGTTPCMRDVPKTAKYKTTCSECGGISKSGATCDNTNVSFSTISYNSNSNSINKKMADYGDQKDKTTMKDGSQNADDSEKQTVKGSKKAKKKKRGRRSRFVYYAGRDYPDHSVGHKVCAIPAKNVPANMGWQWNIKPEGLRRTSKWRPGYLNKTINDRIIERRRQLGIPDPPVLTTLTKKKKFRSTKFLLNSSSDEEDEEVVPKPTLTIQKKDGNYLITMNPLKEDQKQVADNENPYLECKPMQFLIIKQTQQTQTGKNGDALSYKDCLCDEDLKLLEADKDNSSDDELNIEFTTPAGLINPDRMKRSPNVVHTETQFRVEDFKCDDCEHIVPTIYKKVQKVRKMGRK